MNPATVSPLLPAGGGIHHERAVAELQNQGDGRVRDHPPRLFVRDVTVTFHGFQADGERVTVEATMTATLANGNHYINDYCFVMELQDGLIHRVREYVDTARGYRTISGEFPQ